MNVVVQQQALFAADLERRREREAEFEAKHDVWKAEIEDILTRLARVTNEGFKDVNAKIDALVDGQIRTDEVMRKLGEDHRKTEDVMRKLAEDHRKTEDVVRKVGEKQLKTDDQLRKTEELLRRSLRGNRNGDE
jgi:N-methylhydantoinase B/oxoprolinase/acetone carboxylase alpha subunit